MAITTIFYDLGNTLVSFDFAPIYAALAGRSGKTLEETRRLTHERYDEFTCGRMTGGEWHSHLMNAFAMSMPYEAFARLWADIFWPNEAMMGLARKLSGSFRSYLLSNTDEIHLPWCRERFALDSFLDGMVLSYEIGAMKPDRAIYEAGLKHFQLRPQACVFIDDLPANVDAARSVGMVAVAYQSAEQVERDLASLGVNA